MCYSLLLNSEVTKPHALKTFLDELAELGIEKGLIKNKTLSSVLMEKEKGYQNVENTSDNESNNEESSSDIENQEEEQEMASENGIEAEGTQESDNGTENDGQETERSSPETTAFHTKRPCEHCENSNVYCTLIMKCAKCFWYVWVLTLNKMKEAVSRVARWSLLLFLFSFY